MAKQQTKNILTKYKRKFFSSDYYLLGGALSSIIIFIFFLAYLLPLNDRPEFDPEINNYPVNQHQDEVANKLLAEFIAEPDMASTHTLPDFWPADSDISPNDLIIVNQDLDIISPSDQGDDGLNSEIPNNLPINSNLNDQNLPLPVPDNEEVKAALPPPLNRSNLLFGSLYNHFVSTARLDLTNTDLHRDMIMTAMVFPPDYSWTPVAESAVGASEKDYFSSLNLNNFNPSTGTAHDYYERRCVSGVCLEQRGESLYYQGSLLQPPSFIPADQIVAVSIGATTSRWLVGFTLRGEKDYVGRVVYFNGTGWQEVLSGGLTSQYFGRFGFGGDDNDFLVIYGAYLGQAYRLRAGQVTDISSFFSYRVMNSGFKPEVIKSGSGTRSTWYVYSLSQGRPRLVKLWQNNSSEIAGALVFSSSMLPVGDLEGFNLKIRGDSAVASGGSIDILGQMQNKKGEKSWWLLRDQGFHNKNTRQVLTATTAHNSTAIPISIQNIDLSRLDMDATSRDLVKLWFKPATAAGPQPGDWRLVPLGEKMDFATEFMSHYVLRVTFEAVADKFYSPFLSAMSFNYYCQKQD